MAEYAQAKQTLSLTQASITATQQLRTTVSNVFEFLKDGINGEEGKNQFLQKFQELLQAVNKDFTDLEKLGSSMTSMPDLPLATLGPAGQLCLEGNADERNLYQDTLMTYQWYTKLHSRAMIATSLLHAYKRTSPSSATSIVRRRRGSAVPQTIKPHILTPGQVEGYIQNLLRHHQELSIKIIYSQGMTRILQISVEKVFYALMLCKNLLMEKILVRGIDEDINDDSDCPDMFTPSRYECMRQVSDHATSVLLYLDQYPHFQVELKPRFVMTWLQGYKNLFTDSCQKCGKILSNGLPPTFRDFKSHAPFHASCR